MADKAKARVLIRETVITTLKEYGEKATLDALQKEAKVLRYWNDTKSIRKRCKEHPKLADIAFVTEKKVTSDKHDKLGCQLE